VSTVPKPLPREGSGQFTKRFLIRTTEFESAARYRGRLGAFRSIPKNVLRDTFAVEMLLAGVPIDQVSMLLGHSSVKITEKHYSPWVKARQDQLAASVRNAWVTLDAVPASLILRRSTALSQPLKHKESRAV
jgi:integrase